MSEETNHGDGDKPAVPSNPLLGEKCGHQCRTLAGLHTCTLKKGHRFCHQEYGQVSCPVDIANTFRAYLESKESEE
jgi:hypothetical protein